MSAALVRPAPFTKARFVRTLVVGAVVAAIAVAVSLSLGAERIDVLAVLGGGGSGVDREIFFQLRLPRVLTGALVGGGLAAAGVAFQALLRNPLAEPYLLGISGGGSLGAVVAIVVGGAAGSAIGIPFLAIRTVAALAGCLCALGLVHAIATRGGVLRPSTLLLAGVVVNAFFLAGLACVQYVATPEESQAILRWILGGLETGGPAETIVLALVVPLAVAALAAHAPSLQALVFGEDTARHLGVDVDGVRRRTFVLASAMTAASVAVAGPIGFVGLVVPHAVRIVTGSDPRALIPASFFAGAAFLPLADAAARTVLAPRELPVGVVTALVGAPAFLVLVVRRGATREAMRG